MQRPAVAVAKTDHSFHLSDTLHNGSLADDRKVREYIGALHRYLNVGNRTQNEKPPKINWTTEPAKRGKRRPKEARQRGLDSGTSTDSLYNVYTNPRASGSFGGIHALKRYTGQSERKVKKFLGGRDAYTLHRPRRIRFPRRRTCLLYTSPSPRD